MSISAAAERLARRAARLVPAGLGRYRDFAGVGVVADEKNPGAAAVAIYVTRPLKGLSKTFLDLVPPYIEIEDGGRVLRVRTCVVHIGELAALGA